MTAAPKHSPLIERVARAISAVPLSISSTRRSGSNGLRNANEVAQAAIAACHAEEMRHLLELSAAYLVGSETGGEAIVLSSRVDALLAKLDGQPSMKPTEFLLQMAVADMFDTMRNTVLFNLQFCGGEMDVCCITKAGYVREVEVKCTLADWNADQHKGKWKKGGWCEKERAKVCEFYYAVPSELINRVPEWVPPEAGLIEVYWFQGSYARFRAEVRRPAKRSSKHTVTAQEWQGICRHLYYRHRTALISRHCGMLREHYDKVPAA